MELTLVVKTNKPEVFLALLRESEIVWEESWEAKRELSDLILKKIEQGLQSLDQSWPAINGIIVHKGPGSFTGLRIGVTVASTLAYSGNVPLVGVNGDTWLKDGIDALAEGLDQKVIEIEYGGEANITTPKK